MHVGKAFAGENIGVRQVAIGTWLVSFLDYELGYLDEGGRLLPAPAIETLQESAAAKGSQAQLPMSPV